MVYVNFFNAGRGVGRIGALVLLSQAFIWLVTAAALGSARIPPDLATNVPDRVTPVAVFGDDERQDLPENLGALEGRIGMLY